MSLFETIHVPCPSCSADVAFDAVHSVNADRRPDLRQAILDGTFQRKDCGACGTSFRVEPAFTYLDAKRGQWLAVRPAPEKAHWQQAEGDARSLFDRSFGDAAGAAGRMLGRNLQPRVVFGWAALREKLVAAEAGLSDVELELLKLALMRGRVGVAMDPDAELRLGAVTTQTELALRAAGDAPEDLDESEAETVTWEQAESHGGDATDGVLILGWLTATDEQVAEGIQAPQALYDQIAADAADWQPLRDEVSQGLLVDLHRLL